MYANSIWTTRTVHETTRSVRHFSSNSSHLEAEAGLLANRDSYNIDLRRTRQLLKGTCVVARASPSASLPPFLQPGNPGAVGGRPYV